jgi:glycerophosphoryl diester phosphodiesterase
MWTRRAPGEAPLVIGHRGSSAQATENTLAAFERARADRADGVELDVLLCRSGEAVVFHDDDLRRLAGRPERIADLDLGALRAVRLTAGGGVSTLPEVFEACGTDLLVNVELKAAPGLSGAAIRALVERVASDVARAGARTAERVLVSSFNPFAVRAWMRRVPGVHAGLLFERTAPLPFRRAWPAVWLRPFSLHPDLVLCTPTRVAAWHRRGYAVAVWTVDAPEALRACRDMHVDAVITNDPAASRAVISAPG